MSKKQKSCIIRSDLSENMPILLQNSFVAITMSLAKNQSKKGDLVKNTFFKIKSNQLHWFILPFAVKRLNCRIPYKL